MIYPGINKVEENHIIRSIGKGEKISQLGFGFMHKPDKTIDEKDSIFSFLSVVYIIRGEGTYIDEEGNKYPLTQGSVFFRYPGIKHSTYINPHSNWSECYMDFGSYLYNLFIDMNIMHSDQPVLYGKSNRSIEEQIFANMIKLRDCEEQILPDLLLESIGLLRNIQGNITHGENNVENYNMIKKSCSDFVGDLSQRYDLKKYCNKNGWGYESFRKIFKANIGLSPGKYIVRRRVDKACQLLRGTLKSISQISFELGYKSQYEFSSQFKREMGLSPKFYRQSK